jgi:hypothetical protein
MKEPDHTRWWAKNYRDLAAEALKCFTPLKRPTTVTREGTITLIQLEPCVIRERAITGLARVQSSVKHPGWPKWPVGRRAYAPSWLCGTATGGGQDNGRRRLDRGGRRGADLDGAMAQDGGSMPADFYGVVNTPTGSHKVAAPRVQAGSPDVHAVRSRTHVPSFNGDYGNLANSG